MSLEIQTLRSVTKNYGVRDTNQKYGGRNIQDLIKVATWTFDYDDLPDAAASNQEQVIPANSTIVSAKVRIVTAFTSTSTTSDLTVGLQESDGTEIDNDGLLTAAHLSQATIAVAGAIYDGSTGTAGALVGFTIGTAAGELVVTPSADDLLTGRAEVIVEYMTPGATPA